MTSRRSGGNLQRVLPRIAHGIIGENGEVSVEYLTRLVSALQQVINDISSPATLRCGNFIISDCLEHSQTLNVGDVYVDGAGYLRLRLVGYPPVDPAPGRGVVASVNVSIT
jgi:hypothetical protein